MLDLKLSQSEEECYDYLLGKTRTAYTNMLQGVVNFSDVLTLLMRLRQCCIAPFLLTRQSKRDFLLKELEEDDEARQYLDRFNTGPWLGWLSDKYGTAGIKSTKMTEAVNIIAALESHEKIIVFSSFTSALDLLALACQEIIPEFNFHQIDGDTSEKSRDMILEKFRNKKDCNGLFLTYKVGGQGINLIEANYVLLLDPWWSPDVKSQAEARSLRIGQTKRC